MEDLDEYIFSFNLQNEGQGHLNDDNALVPEWWCDRAAFMRDMMGDSMVMISTGKCQPPLEESKGPELMRRATRRR